MAFVQAIQKSGSLSTTQAFASPSTAGDTILVITDCFDGPAGSVTSVTDNQGNTYTNIGTSFAVSEGTHTHNIDFWVATAGSTGVIAVTAHGSNEIFFSLLNYTGFSSFTFDQSASASNGSATSQSSGATGTTSAANELLVSYIVPSGTSDPTISAGSGYTKRCQFQDLNFTAQFAAVEDQTVSSTGTFSGDWTLGTARLAGVVLVTFNIGGSPPPAGTRPKFVLVCD